MQSQKLQRTVQDNYELLFGKKTKIIRPQRRLRPTDGKWKLIVFLNGIRVIKYPLQWEEAKALYKKYKEKGLHVAVAHRTNGNYEPKGEGEPGQRWCGYCRSWRYFKVPKYGVLGDQAIACCPYCGISENDYYIRLWNGEPTHKRKSRASIRRRRQRVTRK